jgi:hypothetical protein
VPATVSESAVLLNAPPKIEAHPSHRLDAMRLAEILANFSR